MAQGARRGEPSGGLGPDFRHYTLGNDPNWLGNFAQQGQNLDQAAQQVGNMGQVAGQTYGQRANELSQGYGSRADSAQGRAAPTTTYDPGLAAAQASNARGGAAQYGLANRLASMATAPQGPSAAQAQLRQGTDAAIKANLAMARSGSGFGESANALDAAGRNASGAIANEGTQSAILRANEDQAYRQNQANLLGLSGQTLASARGADAGLAGQLAQQGQFNTSTALQQGAQNDAYSQALYQNELQGQQLGLQANEFATQAQQQAVTQQQQNQQTQLQAAQAQQQGTMGYEGDLNSIYQTDMNHNIEARKLDMQKDKDRVSGVGQAIGAVAGMVGLSDRRSKERITELEDELARTYAALGGAGGVKPSISPDEKRRMLGDIDDAARENTDYLGEDDHQAFGTPLREPAVYPTVGTGREQADLAANYRPVRAYGYDYKDPSMPGAAPGRQSGPMADELKGLPGVVKPGPNGMDYVDEGRLTMTNASELGQQRRELDELRKKLDALGGALSSGNANDTLQAASGGRY